MKDLYQSYDAVQLATDEDFIRWVKGNTPQQEADWAAWLDQHPDKVPVVEEARGLVQAIRFEAPAPQVDTERLWQRIRESTREDAAIKPLPGRRLILYRIGAAAAAAVAVILYLIFGLPSTRQISTDINQHLAFTLPDQSTVTLNAATRLDYSKNGRSVQLQGEAFFDVATDSSATFSVETALGTIRVLGTQFNVYSRGSRFQVKCTEGRVQVTTTNDPQGVILTPGMACSLTSDGKLATETLTGLEAEVDWLADIYRFKEQPLRVVFEEMERQFDIDIQANDSILDILHTGYFEGNRLDSALLQVCYPHDLNSSITEKTVRITKAETE